MTLSTTEATPFEESEKVLQGLSVNSTPAFSCGRVLSEERNLRYIMVISSSGFPLISGSITHLFLPLPLAMSSKCLHPFTELNHISLLLFSFEGNLSKSILGILFTLAIIFLLVVGCLCKSKRKRKGKRPSASSSMALSVLSFSSEYHQRHPTEVLDRLFSSNKVNR